MLKSYIILISEYILISVYVYMCICVYVYMCICVYVYYLSFTWLYIGHIQIFKDVFFAMNNISCVNNILWVSS